MTSTLDSTAPGGPGAPGARVREAVAGRYLTVTVTGEAYALDINVITEIIAHRPLTAVPMMPGFIRGVMNLRGRVLPVVDLSARFGRADTEVARRTSIVVVEVDDGDGGRRDIGVMVDAVNKVVHLAGDDLQVAPDFGVGISTDYIAGMARLDDQFVVILDAENVLDATVLADLPQE